MSGSNLSEALLASLQVHCKTRRILIAYSGGLDSRVLLHLAANNRDAFSCVVEAVHIDHGLQSGSAAWAATCVHTCQSYDIHCHVLNAQLKPEKGESIEALARDKRYQLFASLMQEHDLLLLAQHADDQAETVLLQLLRGAGPEGLSAMPISREFANGNLIRPLLSFSRAALETYANSCKLDWIVDPSNDDDRFDRNYLRKQIFPLIETRFPGYRKTLARSASHCAELVQQSSSDSDSKLHACLKPDSHILLLSALKKLPQTAQKQVLRSWIKQSHHKAPQTQQLALMLKTFCSDKPPAMAAVTTSQYQVRRYQDGLYVVDTQDTTPFHYHWQDLTKPLYVAELNLELSLPYLLALGLKLDLSNTCVVTHRKEGERLRTERNGGRKSIKKLFQEQAIPPWERDKYPFIYQNDKLVAVLGLAVHIECQQVPDIAINAHTVANAADT